MSTVLDASHTLDTSPAMVQLTANSLRGAVVNRGDINMAAATLDELALEKQRAVEGITDAVVDQFRRHLWESWGQNRMASELPSHDQLRGALDAAAIAFASEAARLAARQHD